MIETLKAPLTIGVFIGLSWLIVHFVGVEWTLIVLLASFAWLCVFLLRLLGHVVFRER